MTETLSYDFRPFPLARRVHVRLEADQLVATNGADTTRLPLEKIVWVHVSRFWRTRSCGLGTRLGGGMRLQGPVRGPGDAAQAAAFETFVAALHARLLAHRGHIRFTTGGGTQVRRVMIYTAWVTIHFTASAGVCLAWLLGLIRAPSPTSAGPLAMNAALWVIWSFQIMAFLRGGPLREYSPDRIHDMLDNPDGARPSVPVDGSEAAPAGGAEPSTIAARSGILRAATEITLAGNSLMATRRGRTTEIALASVTEVLVVRENRRAALSVRDASGGEICGYVVAASAQSATDRPLDRFDAFVRELHGRLRPRADQVLFTAGCLTSPARATGIAASLGCCVAVGCSLPAWQVFDLRLSIPLGVIIVTTAITLLVRWCQIAGTGPLYEYRPAAVDEILDPKSSRARFPQW